MKKRNIGKSELAIAPMVLGGNVFGWTASEKTSFDILDAFVGEGFNMIDTADVYSAWAPGNKGGESETIIGKWLVRSGQRNNVLLATKVGAEFSKTQRGLKKSYIIKQVEESLARLKTDYIDLYYTHHDDLSTPVEETLEAYAQLVKEGKIRYIGASNMSGARLRESIDVSRQKNFPEYICLQAQYNMYDRKEYEEEYEDVLKELNLGSLPYYSLASGFLTGKYKRSIDVSMVPRNGALKNYMNERGQNILDALHTIARLHVTTPAQIALAWLLHRESVTAPIASVSKVDQFDILDFVKIKLDKISIELLNKASEY